MCGPFARLDAGTVAALLLPFVPVFAVFNQQIADPDLWWHLAAGRWIVEHGTVPWVDPFSYTASGHLWIAYSWLPELLFHVLARDVGFHALILATAGICSLLVALVYRGCRSAGASPAAALLATALASLGSAGAWATRPQLISLVLLAALVALLQPPSARTRLPWAAPIVLAVWANVHILFFFGVGLLGLRAICQTIEGERSWTIWAATVASAAALLINPYGWRLIEHVPTMLHQPSVVRFVSECQSPDFRGSLGLALGTSVIGMVAVLAVSRLRPTLWELATVLGTLAAGLYMARNMAIFAIVAAPVVARHLDSVLPKKPAEAVRRIPAGLLAFHYSIVVVALASAASQAPRAAGWRENLAPGVFPVAAVDYVAEHYGGARLFNEFDAGGFVIFRLWPRTQVSIDGRTQVYGERILTRYLHTYFVDADWERYLRECDPEVILWPAGTPLAAVLDRSPRWRRAFADETAVVFVRADRPS